MVGSSLPTDKHSEQSFGAKSASRLPHRSSISAREKASYVIGALPSRLQVPPAFALLYLC